MKIKKLVATTLLTVMAFTVTACGSNVEKMTSLLTGSIDSDVKGIATDQYVKDTAWSLDEIIQDRESMHYDLATLMHIVYGISGTGEPNSIIAKEVMSYYTELLEKFEYEVVESVGNEDGSVLVTIKYRPFLLGLELDKVAYPYYDEMPEQDSMSMDEYVNTHDKNLFELLFEVMEGFIENPVLGDEITMDIEVYVLPDDSWSLGDNYYDEFLPGIIDLNLEE